MHKLIPIAMVATAALAAGCGGNSDNTLTKSQVIAQGSVICKRAERSVETLPQIAVEHPFAKGTSAKTRSDARAFLAGYATALDSSRVGLSKLKAPKEDKALLDGYLHDIGLVVAKLRSASTAPAADVEDQANAAFGLFDEASKQTARYGFPKGVCGSGSSS
jgi:hypothetical protein